jgi:hypothetical protein
MTRNQEFHGHSMFIPWVAAFTVIDCDPFYQAHSNANFLTTSLVKRCCSSQAEEDEGESSGGAFY